MSSADEAAREALGKKFKILREIGQGGSAKVYLAEELGPGGRTVAVKVLLHSRASATSLERFRMEINIASRLVHPHIVSLFYTADVDDLPYYVMPYIEGESLRSHLIRDRTLSVERAVTIAMEVADALHYAHAVGVIHRDIKPENILMSGGHSWVADFGIAKAITASGLTGRRENITDTGEGVPGTGPYMSPEQVWGDSDLDGRSDLFSLGIVLYEMLAGRTPWHRAELREEMLARFSQPPPPLSTVRSDVPASIEGAIVRALKVAENDRFASADEFRAALSTRPPGPVLQSPVQMPSIAVLPFTMISRDDEDQIFAEGMSEQLINALMRLRRLKVVARESSFASKIRSMSTQDIGRELNVGFVLSGSIQGEGGQLRIHASLGSTSDGFLAWAEQFKLPMGEIFAVQDEIALKIIAAIQPSLLGAEAPKRTPVDDEVNRLVIRGRHFWRERRPGSFAKARQCFERALEIDPKSAQAHAGLADLFAVLSIYGFVSPAESATRARAEALRAIELDPAAPEPRAALGTVRGVFEWDWEEARLEFQRAITINPGYSLGYMWYANYVLIPLGQLTEARVELEKARAVDPLWSMIDTSVGMAHYFARDYEAAEAHLHDALQLDPEHMITHYFLGKTYIELGRTAEAIQAYNQTYQRSGGNPMAEGEIGYAHARAGDRDAAKSTLNHLRAMRAQRFVSSGLEALILVALGEPDEAMRLFEKAVEERAIDLQWLGVHPGLDGMRADPRFQALLRRIKLLPATT